MSDHRAHYYPHIDGLRAIAVLGVLFFHADFGFPGGYVGVDVFFVISGYLLTGLMLRDAAAGQFNLWHFWERRTRRIFPALAVVIVVCFVAAWFVLLPADFKRFASSVIAQAILMQNIYFARLVGYFDQAASVKPLLHTWSLAVEEQFYLLFPMLFMVLRRFARPVIIVAVMVIGALSLGFSFYYDSVQPLRNFYLLPSRAWELLAGVFLAVVPLQRRCSRWLTELVSCSGIIAIAYVMLQDERAVRFPGTGAILACAGAAAIIWANGLEMTTIGKLLSVRPVVFIGLISYSLYLWHWPLLAFSRFWNVDPLPESQRVLLLLVCAVLAAVSWRFVETPFRKRLVFNSGARFFSLVGATSAALSLAAFAVHHWNGVPSRIPPAALKYADEAAADFKFVGEMSYKFDLKEALSGDFIELGAGDKNLPVDILLWGDSHAVSVIPLVSALCQEHHTRGVAAVHAGTAPLIGYQDRSPLAVSDSISYSNAVAEFIGSKRVRHVVLVAKWGGYADADLIRERLSETVGVLKKMGVRVWVMRQTPKLHWHVPTILALKVMQGYNPEDIGLSFAEYRIEFQRQNHLFEGLAARFAEVTVMDPTPLFVNPQKQLCRVEKDGRALFCDDNHLSTAGANLLRPLFVPIFEGIGKGTVQPVGDTDAKR